MANQQDAGWRQSLPVGSLTGKAADAEDAADLPELDDELIKRLGESGSGAQTNLRFALPKELRVFEPAETRAVHGDETLWDWPHCRDGFRTEEYFSALTAVAPCLYWFQTGQNMEFSEVVSASVGSTRPPRDTAEYFEQVDAHCRPISVRGKLLRGDSPSPAGSDANATSAFQYRRQELWAHPWLNHVTGSDVRCAAPTFAPFSKADAANRNDEDQAFKKLYCLGMPKMLCRVADEDGKSTL